MTDNDPVWGAPEWLREHRSRRPYGTMDTPRLSRESYDRLVDDNLVHVAQTAFNNHSRNTGEHVSPFDTGEVQVGVDGLEVRLAQGVNLDALRQVLIRGVRATIGMPRPTGPGPMSDRLEVSDEAWQEMFRGGLQGQLESQVLTFEVWGASRVLTHQLVRSTRARFNQQSQRSTFYGDRPEVRMPETVWRAGPLVRDAWLTAYEHAWLAYKEACDAGVPYEDARYILPEGTVNYIVCSYSIREFLNVFAYRGCSMFLREMVTVMRMMRELVLQQCPELEPFIKISCEKGKICSACEGTGWLHMGTQAAATMEEVRANGRSPEHDPAYNLIECYACSNTGGRKCTFQGWENVELACDFPWARENNRVFIASDKLRIASKGKS